MKVTKIPGLGSYGVYIDDVDFAKLTTDEWMEIGSIHMQNLVTIIRNCNLKWADMSAWLSKFGDKRYALGYYFRKKYPNHTMQELIQLANTENSLLSDDDRLKIANMMYMQEFDPHTGSNVTKVTGKKDENGNPMGMFANGDLDWHSNEGGSLTFTPGVALLASENVVGSSTGFLQTADFYETISDSFRSELDDMVIEHKFFPGKTTPGLDADQEIMMQANQCPVDGIEIPMVIKSPGGITGLHYSVNTASCIKGLTTEQSQRIFDDIEKQLFVDEYIYDHWYQNDGDLCLFDNSITLHRRLGDTSNRLCHRVQHDYSNLQENFWQPYIHPEYAARYEREIVDFVNTTGVKDFKLPSSYKAH